MALFLGGKKVTINTETRRNVPIDTTLSASSTNPVTNSAITTSLNSIQTSMTSAQGDISTLQASMTTAEGNISTLQASMTTAQGNISTLQASMTTAENNISTLQASMTSVLERLTVLEGYHTGSNEGVQDNLDDILG